MFNFSKDISKLHFSRLILLFLILSTLFSTAYGKEEVNSFGLKGGLNFSRIVEFSRARSSEFRTDPVVTLFYNRYFSPTLIFETGISYSGKGEDYIATHYTYSFLPDTKEKLERKVKYLEIPATIGYSNRFADSFEAIFSGGIYIALLYKAEVDDIVDNDQTMFSHGGRFNNIDYGLTAETALRFYSGNYNKTFFLISFKTSLGIRDVYDSESTLRYYPKNAKNLTLSISVGIGENF